MNKLTVLVKIERGEEEAQARALSDINWDQAANAIMRPKENGRMRCARWAIITEPPTEPRLLFACKFDGDLDGYVDALLEETQGIDEIWRRWDGFMTLQAEPFRRRLGNIPRFVSVTGGGYFFLPGIAALNYLAGH